MPGVPKPATKQHIQDKHAHRRDKSHACILMWELICLQNLAMQQQLMLNMMECTELKQAACLCMSHRRQIWLMQNTNAFPRVSINDGYAGDMHN